MMRAAWRGYITIGRLGIPVRLYTATRANRPRFVQLHEKDGSPVERLLYCREEHKAISSDEIIRAVELETGGYLTLTDQELEQSGNGPVKTIDVKQFCDPALIAPIYYEKPYYVVPTKGGERAYALLREVFSRTGKVAVTKFMIYAQEHVATLGLHGDLLVLYQLRFASEILPRTDITSPALPKPSPTELETLLSVVDRYDGPFYVEDYHDTHAERVNLLIERKSQGLPMPRPERVAAHATPDDSIITTLRQTLDDPKTITGAT